MSDAPTSDESDDDESRPTESLRPIPDGGLRAAMPEWLRQSPAWRTRTMNTVGEAPRQPVVPDASPIDPRTILDLDDLPQWLQAIAARSAGGNPEPSLPGEDVARATAEIGPKPHVVPVRDSSSSSPPIEPAASMRSGRPGGEIRSGLDSPLVPALLILILLVGLALLGIWLYETI